MLTFTLIYNGDGNKHPVAEAGKEIVPTDTHAYGPRLVSCI